MFQPVPTSLADTSTHLTPEETKDWIEERVRVTSTNWLSKSSEVWEWESETAQLLPHSDINAADEIAATFPDLIHYVPGSGGSGTWRVWNGIFHERIDGDQLAHWVCRAFLKQHKDVLAKVKANYDAQARTLQGQAAADKRGEYQKKVFGEHRAYRDKIHMNGGIQGLMSEVKRMFTVSDTHFVDDRQWLVLQNGVIDLHELSSTKPATLADIKLLPHDPRRPVWRSVNASLDPSATAEHWQDFITSSLPDPELRKFLAVTLGAAFAGASKTKTIPVLLGPPNSGKTVLVDRMYTLGGGYSAQPSGSAIIKSTGQNFEQHNLCGVRFVGISEPDTLSRVDEGFLKQFTGGDMLSTRTLHGRSVAWKSQGMLFVATNYELKLNTSDLAIVGRFATVRFPNRFWDEGLAPAGQEHLIKKKNLELTLELESDGILSWVLNGMLVYLRDGIVIPESIKAHRADQYAGGNSVHLWADYQLTPGETLYRLDSTPRPASHYVNVQDLYDDFKYWAALNEPDDIPGRTEFSKRLVGYLRLDTVKSNGIRIAGIVPMDRLGTSSEN